MKLSVDNINDKSPYWVIQLDEMQFRFRTVNGVTYHVGFYPDSYFMPGLAYHFYISNIHDLYAPKDHDVFRVITVIIEEFFRQNSSVMLYICDPTDKREYVRANMYKRWFDNYERKNELILRAADLNFQGIIVYTGLIIRKDNPDSAEILNYFDAFVQKAPSMYAPTSKP